MVIIFSMSLEPVEGKNLQSRDTEQMLHFVYRWLLSQVWGQNGTVSWREGCVVGALCLSSGLNLALAFAGKCVSPFATAVFIIMRKVICVNQHKFGVSDLIKPGKMYDIAHTLQGRKSDVVIVRQRLRISVR